MGKCRFDALWLDRGTFKPWLKAVQGNPYEARCFLCKKDIKLGTLGVKALESHAKSVKHQTCIRALQQTRPLPVVPQGGSDDATDPPPANPPRPRPPTGRIDQALGSSPTLVAEVLWTLETVARHQSYNSNEGIGEIFKKMFPDSEIVQSFHCGADKTAYITKFGLAEYIKRELVLKINKGPFVVMFDESLNHATKTKQLDIHVRFWDEGKVQSRYLGSEFMGHSTAKDLLAHIKVSHVNGRL